MTRRAHVPLSLAALVALVAHGCGGGSSFEPTFREYREPGFSAFVSELQRTARREETPVVAVVTRGSAPHVVVWDLAHGAKLWDRAVHDITAAPIVAGDAVVTQEGARVVLRKLSNGDELTTINCDEGEKLVGADGVHDLVAVSLRLGPDLSAHGRLLAFRGGSTLWDHDVELPLGVPAVVGRLVLAPWGTQQVTVLDSATGREETRLRIADDVVGVAFADRGQVYFGQHGIFRITPSITSASKHHAAYFTPRGRPLPGQPLFLRDGYEAAPAPGSAHHSLRLAWRPAGEGETITLEDDSLYFVFYSLLFSESPTEDALHWVYTRPVDIVGVQAQPGGILVADAAGKLAFVAAADGRQTWEVDTGVGAIDSACVRAGDWVPTATPASEPVPSVTERLFAAASVNDARLGAGRALAATYMNRDDAPAVTGHLVTLCAAADSPLQLKTAACEALAERTTGDSFVLDALAQRESYLESTPTPPVGALARAAAKMGLRRAVPDLLAHLADPATASTDLPPLLESFATLHAANAARPIEDFLRLYHADPDDAHTAEALGVAADTLVLLRGHGSDAVLHHVADDPATPQTLRDRITRDLTTGVPAATPAHPETPPTPPTPPHPPPPPPTPTEPDTRPPQLSGELIAATLHPIDRQLAHCLSQATPPPASVRAMITVGTDGDVTRVSVSVPAVSACIEHQLRTRRFPETRLGHPQQVTWEVRRDLPTIAAPQAPHGGGGHRLPDGGVAPAPHARPDGGVARPHARPDAGT